MEKDIGGAATPRLGNQGTISSERKICQLKITVIFTRSMFLNTINQQYKVEFDIKYEVYI